MFRIAVIGCGKIGYENSLYNKGADYSYIGTINNIKNLKLTAICDINYKKIKNISKKFRNINIYTSYKELLRNNNLDIIIIATPDKTHYSIIRETLKYKIKGIIIEKPSLGKLSEIYKIVKYNKKKVLIQVNYTRRFIKDYHEIKKKIDQNFFGKIININFTFSNGLIHNGCHFFDLCNLWLKNFTFCKSVINEKSYGTNDIYGIFLFKKKNINIIFNVIKYKNTCHQKIEIIGERNSVIINNNNQILFFEKAEHSKYKNFFQNNLKKIKNIKSSSAIRKNINNLINTINRKERLISPIKNEIKWRELITKI